MSMPKETLSADQSSLSSVGQTKESYNAETPHANTTNADLESKLGHNELDSPRIEKKSTRFYITIAILCLSSVVASMDSVIVAAVLNAIAADLNASSTDAFWVGTSFLMAQTVNRTASRIKHIRPELQEKKIELS
jgi:hypothetical protein